MFIRVLVMSVLYASVGCLCMDECMCVLVYVLVVIVIIYVYLGVYSV